MLIHASTQIRPKLRYTNRYLHTKGVTMQQKINSYQMACGAVMLAIAVSAGAFGSPGFDSFGPRSLLPLWHTAALYPLIHEAGTLGIVVGRAHGFECWQN